MRNQYEYYSPFEVHTFMIIGRLTSNIPARNRYENYSPMDFTKFHLKKVTAPVRLESTTDNDKTDD